VPNGVILRVSLSLLVFCSVEIVRGCFPLTSQLSCPDNLGAILAAADIISRNAGTETRVLTMEHVLLALIKSYEIQGVFQIKNAFNKVGLDHVILVKVASTAVVSWLLNLSREAAKAAVSHAWLDGHPLRIYRQAPNTGPRKGWAAGDACMRAVHLAMLAKAGQPGVNAVLTTPRWGFYDVLFDGKPFDLPQEFGSWVMENVLFKVNTAEGHGLTGIEAALIIAQRFKDFGLAPDKDIASIRVRTQESAMKIINKNGPLHNPADRDHCLKYMIAVVLLKGTQIDTDDYQNGSPWATDPRVELLRQKISLVEDPQFTVDYHTLDKRSISNGLSVQLVDGTQLEEVVVEFPQGHVRRAETPSEVRAKARRNLGLKLSPERVDEILSAVDSAQFLAFPVDKFTELFVV
jgi:2-methylcitrate dehydratase